MKKGLMLVIGLMILSIFILNVGADEFYSFDKNVLMEETVIDLGKVHLELARTPFFYSFYSSFEAVEMEIRTKMVEDSELETNDIKEPNIEETLIIKIIEGKFVPNEMVVERGQEVTWVNERKRNKALVRGLREINDLDSGFLNPGDSFKQTFSEVGEYTYVDGVIIGVVGKIIVK